MRFSSSCLAVAALLLAGAPSRGQTDAAVMLTGLEGQQIALPVATLDALPRVAVSVVQHGATHRYEGALLSDVLAKVHAPSGTALHGADLADVVLVEAADGYKVAFGLAEVDR